MTASPLAPCRFREHTAVHDVGHSASTLRARRVILLLVGVVIFSVLDLAITVTHLRSLGMMEANPIAAYLIRTTNSAIVLSAYKLLTVTVCVALLYWLRHRKEGEVAAWASMAILALMCIIWHVYTVQIDDIEAMTLAQSGAYGENWLFLD